MADEVAAPAPSSPPKKKKLPFKPTALRRTVVTPNLTPVDSSNGSDDHSLDLFRRSKEMAPIVAADRERRMRRKQKHADAGRRRSSTSMGEKRPREGGSGMPSREPSMGGPSPSTQRTVVLDDDDGPALDESMTVTGDSFSELVTPPPSKRSRLDSGSSRRVASSIDDVASEFEASPSARRGRSRQDFSTPIRETKFENVTARQESRAATATPTRPPANAAIEGATTTREPRIKSATPARAVISIDSDSDDDVKPHMTPIRNRLSSFDIVDSASPVPPPAAPSTEEDEFAEYIRKAEEQQARSQALLQTVSDGPGAKTATELYITSAVPNVKHMVFKFRFDKPLGLARSRWIFEARKEGVLIPADQDDDVVLTWRRKKIYNTTTLLSLGIRPAGDGRLEAAGRGSRNGFTKAQDKTQDSVHMEAWTPELFLEMERHAELERRRNAGESSDEDEPEEPPPPEVKLRITLKALDYAEFGLGVRPETTVETVMTGFRTRCGIGSDRDVSLWFDGDKLEEHVTMDEAEIMDMDTIEVHIK
ncbi:hypothetical protein G7046_g8061 [Stylonectria norvegica]|nr:hypothetical protein G7046_g8061 [Stylonectria norvegica]